MTVNSTITIKSSAGDFAAYVAYPDADKAPAVAVLHEVFGVNEDIRLTCQALAAQGFIAIAPDLFWRQEMVAETGGEREGGHLVRHS